MYVKEIKTNKLFNKLLTNERENSVGEGFIKFLLTWFLYTNEGVTGNSAFLSSLSDSKQKSRHGYDSRNV